MPRREEMHLRIRRLYAYANVAHLVAHPPSSRLYAGKRFASAAKFIEFRATVPRVMHISKFNAFWRRWYNGEHGTSITASVSQFAICDFWIAARMLQDDTLVKMIERHRGAMHGTDKGTLLKIPLKDTRIHLHNFT